MLGRMNKSEKIFQQFRLSCRQLQNATPYAPLGTFKEGKNFICTLYSLLVLYYPLVCNYHVYSAVYHCLSLNTVICQFVLGQLLGNTLYSSDLSIIIRRNVNPLRS